MASQTQTPAPSLSPTVEVKQDSPATQNPLITHPTPNATEDLWSDAIKLLRTDDGEELRLEAADKLTVLSEVLIAAKEKRDQCKDRQWKYKKSDGTVIVLRDVFDKMVKWLNKLEQIGDFVAQLDSTHLALPWAAIKFFLQVKSLSLATHATHCLLKGSDVSGRFSEVGCCLRQY
jgi:hypothetical protein